MFKVKLLTELINKYHRSKSEKKDIWIKPYSHKLFKQYYSTTGFAIADQIDKDIKDLEEKKFIKVIINDNQYERIYLCNDKLNKIYLYLNIDNPINIKNEIISEVRYNLQKYNCDITKIYFAFLSNLNDISKEISLDDINTIFKGLYYIEIQTEEILLRNFSKKVFGDSKFLEKNINKFYKIFSLCDEYIDKESFLNIHNIFKNYRNLTFKNSIKFKVVNQFIDLSDFKNEFILSSNCLNSLELLDIKCKKVITIENKTTFQYFNDDCLVIYTNGFPSSTLITFIKIVSSFKKMDWYHYGDIDLGGFKIFNFLKDKTNINFKPYNMNKDQLIRYKSECISLSDKEIKELIKNKENYTDFIEVIDFMIKNKIKLEQESIE